MTKPCTRNKNCGFQTHVNKFNGKNIFQGSMQLFFKNIFTRITVICIHKKKTITNITAIRLLANILEKQLTSRTLPEPEYKFILKFCYPRLQTRVYLPLNSPQPQILAVSINKMYCTFQYPSQTVGKFDCSFSRGSKRKS